MAEETKVVNLDDWDNMPLDPADDDWDDVPSLVDTPPKDLVSLAEEQISSAQPPTSSPPSTNDIATDLAADITSLVDDFDAPHSNDNTASDDPSVGDGNLNEPQSDIEGVSDDFNGDGVAEPAPSETAANDSDFDAGDDFDPPTPNTKDDPNDFAANVASDIVALMDDFDTPASSAENNDDDFNTPASSAENNDDDFDTPTPSVENEGDDFDTEVASNVVTLIDDFDAPDSPGSPDDDDDFDAPDSPSDDEPAEKSFAEHLTEQGSPDESSNAPGSPAPTTNKKVELDIEGFFDGESEKELNKQLAEMEEQAFDDEESLPDAAPFDSLPEAGSEEAEGEEKPKKSRLKLLILIGVGLLLLGGIGFAVFALFFTEEEPPPPPLIINPQPPARNLIPGDLPLEPFYLSFPGSQGETIVEMTVSLHYLDEPDKLILDAQLPEVRDIIYRLTQSKGSQVISSGEIQSALKLELAKALNTALKGERLSYVQIQQIRILQ